MPGLVQFILILLISLSFTAFAENMPAATKATSAKHLMVVGVAKNDTLNLRHSASGKSAIVMELPNTARGLVKLAELNGWVQVVYKNTLGWAYYKYLKADKAPTVSSALSTELFCIGTEPHWNFTSNTNALTLKQFDNAESYILSAAPEKHLTDKAWLFYAVNPLANNSSLSINIKHDALCTDNMSDDNYTYSITINKKNENTLNGCCNRK